MDRVRVSAVAVMMCVVGMPVPPASADPGFPNVSAYPEADVTPYSVGLDFLGYFRGYQFTAPSGYRCRMYGAAKTYPSRFGECWGTLPGTSENTVYMSEDWAAKYTTKDLSEFDKYSVFSSAVEGSEVEKRFGPDDYKMLPAGSRLYGNGVTCVVDAHMTACITDKNLRTGEQHGFVLAPQNSQLF